MDILVTGVAILIILGAVAPFFLMSGMFGAPKKPKVGKDRNDGPIIPVPPEVDGAFHGGHGKKHNPDADSGNDGGSDGGDGGGGGTD